MQDAAIAVAVNKTDAPGALSVTEVQEAMGLSTYVRRLVVRLHASAIGSSRFMHSVIASHTRCRSHDGHLCNCRVLKDHPWQAMPTSAVSGTGLEDVWRFLAERTRPI